MDDNLFAPPEADPATDDVVVAEEVEPAITLPRVWTILVVVPASIMLAAIAGGAAALAAMLAADPTLPTTGEAFASRLESVYVSPLGPFLLGIGSLVFLMGALLPAYLSPVEWRQRLGLKPIETPLGETLLLVGASPLVGLVGSVLVGLLTSGESENMRLFYNIIQGSASPPRLAMLFFVIAIMPGVAEELLFRGYLQRRLLEVWPARSAIALSTFLFAAAHLEPIHVLSVAPLGAWLGFIAWRANSTWPSIVAHAFNNALAIIIMMNTEF
ncbi:MAG: CPBP family intramembrane metalloprotease [Planctomycetales bacterium]|nr:CPBP family intramembrane metalloprotease [Planctomycetales bacterium]